TGAGDGAVVPPFLQHRAVFGDLVLVFLAGQQVVRVNVFKPDEDPPHACRSRLLDEVRNAVAQRVDLDRETDRQSFAEPQMDHSVEQRFPMAIAGEIVVGDKKPLDPLRVVLAYRSFEIVGGAEPAFPPLYVDDRAERALVGATAPEIKARQRTGD